MNKAIFNYLSKKLIRTPEAREAASLYFFEGLSAYQAEINVYGRPTVTVKKIVNNLTAAYREALQIGIYDQYFEGKIVYRVNKTLHIKILESLPVYAYIGNGDIIALQSANNDKDLSILLDICVVYDDIEGQLIEILESNDESFIFNY